MLLGLNKSRKSHAEAAAPSPLDLGLGFTIRFGYADDAYALRRLAAYDSKRPLTGRVLVAEVDGELWAAVSIEDQRVIADPFHHTTALVAVLSERATAGAPAPRAHIPARGAGRPTAAPAH